MSWETLKIWYLMLFILVVWRYLCFLFAGFTSPGFPVACQTSCLLPGYRKSTETCHHWSPVTTDMYPIGTQRQLGHCQRGLQQIPKIHISHMKNTGTPPWYFKFIFWRKSSEFLYGMTIDVVISHLVMNSLGVRAFLRWWPPSTIWAGPLIILGPPSGMSE